MTFYLSLLLHFLAFSPIFVFSSPASLPSTSPIQLDFHLLDFSVKDGVNYIIVEEVENKDEKEVLVTEEQGKEWKKLEEKTVEEEGLKGKTGRQQELEEEETRLKGDLEENEGSKEVVGRPLDVELSSLGGAGEWVGSHLGR